jgi:hypothetical protein
VFKFALEKQFADERNRPQPSRSEDDFVLFPRELPCENFFKMAKSARRQTQVEERIMRGYTYAAVEAALAKVFVTAQKGALRGRIQNLRRLGLPSGGPGRGKTISYTDARVCAWLIALELEEFGVDPALAVRMIKTRWTDLSRFIREAREARHDNDIILVVRPCFMSANWTLGPEVGQEMFSSIRAGAISQGMTLWNFLPKRECALASSI